eukprot:gene16953-biopygen18839
MCHRRGGPVRLHAQTARDVPAEWRSHLEHGLSAPQQMEIACCCVIRSGKLQNVHSPRLLYVQREKRHCPRPVRVHMHPFISLNTVHRALRAEGGRGRRQGKEREGGASEAGPFGSVLLYSRKSTKVLLRERGFRSASGPTPRAARARGGGGWDRRYLGIPAFAPRSKSPHARAPGAQMIRMASEIVYPQQRVDYSHSSFGHSVAGLARTGGPWWEFDGQLGRGAPDRHAAFAVPLGRVCEAVLRRCSYCPLLAFSGQVRGWIFLIPQTSHMSRSRFKWLRIP